MKAKIIAIFLVVLWSASSQALNIKIHEYSNMKIKSYSTNDEFRIPTETDYNKCDLNQQKKDLWSIDCLVKGQDGKWSLAPSFFIECKLKSSIQFEMHDMVLNSKTGMMQQTPRYRVVISCE